MSHPIDDDAFGEGYEAFREGIPEDENPYRGAQHWAWADGWNTAEAEAEEFMKEGSQNG